MHPVSIVGCGYTGLRLAERWLNLARRVRGFGARAQSIRQIAATGADARPLNLDQPLPGTLDFDGQLVYYMVPPAPAADRDGRLENLLERLVGTPQRFIYLSTTGVYGDRQGASVDEDTAPRPKTGRAARRLAAENTLRSWADSRAISWTILRVPGIYGPGRLPLERLRRREPAVDPEEAVPSNRIHVEDLVTVCIAAGLTARAHGRIYNVTDGSNDSLAEYLQRVARIGRLPAPPLVSRSEAQTSFSATSLSFLNESRRVDNRRMLEELGVTLAFHDLDAGIRASL
jgi:nucleoside-diphosphate-sugar epimerase